MKIRNLRSRQNRVSCFGRGEWNEIPAFARMTIFFRCSCGDALHFEKSLRLLTPSVRGNDNEKVREWQQKSAGISPRQLSSSGLTGGSKKVTNVEGKEKVV